MDFKLARSVGIKIERTILQPLAQPCRRRVLTYSSIRTFRDCRELYRLRYKLQLRKQGRVDEPLFVGSLWHELRELELNCASCQQCIDYLAKRMCAPPVDERDHKVWLYLVSMITFYYDYRDRLKPETDRIFTEVEFYREIIGPDGEGHRSFVLAGKIDAAIVGKSSEADIVHTIGEHKSSSQSALTGGYLERLWIDSQLQLYMHASGATQAIHNSTVKPELRQSKGETEEEYIERKAQLAAKNKTGKSSAKRKMPESDGDFLKRLIEWFRVDAGNKHHVVIIPADSKMQAKIRAMIWEIANQIEDCERRGVWYDNDNHCFNRYGRECEMFDICSTGGSDTVINSLYEKRTRPHSELDLIGVNGYDDGHGDATNDKYTGGNGATDDTNGEVPTF